MSIFPFSFVFLFPTLHTCHHDFPDRWHLCCTYTLGIVSGALNELSYMIFPILWSRQYSFCHFTDKETNFWVREVAEGDMDWDLNLGSLTQEPMFYCFTYHEYTRSYLTNSLWLLICLFPIFHDSIKHILIPNFNTNLFSVISLDRSGITESTGINNFMDFYTNYPSESFTNLCI